MTTNQTEGDEMAGMTGDGAFPHMTRVPVRDVGVVERIRVSTARQEDEDRRRILDLYTRINVLEGVVERLLSRLADATDVADVNIAGGVGLQEFAEDGA